MTTGTESLVDINPEAEEAKPKGNFPCRYCPEDSFSTPLVRRNHERSHHAAEFKVAEAERVASREATRNPSRDRAPVSTPQETAEQPDVRVTTLAGDRMEAVSELARQFSEALDSAAPDMKEGKRRQLILAFDNHAQSIARNPVQLERFLNECGLTAPQSAFIKLIMVGMDGGTAANDSHWSMPDGSPQAMTWDPHAGRMVPAPIFMMNGNSPAASSTPPPFFFMPPGYGHNPNQGEGLTKRDLEEVVEKLADKLTPAAPAQPPPSANMRRYQQPVIGSDGQPMTDEGGRYIMAWVEEPMDPLSNAFQMLTNLGVLNKNDAPAITAEDISQAVVEGVQQVIPATKETDPEVAELKREVADSHKTLQDYIHRSELKDAEQKAADDAVTRTMTAVQPMLDELRDVRSKTGLTDRQYELRHEETLHTGILGAVQQGLAGLRADLQPFAMQGMVAQMKSLGLEDNVIGDILQRMAPPMASAATSGVDRRAETFNKWVND